MSKEKKLYKIIAPAFAMLLASSGCSAPTETYQKADLPQVNPITGRTLILGITCASDHINLNVHYRGSKPDSFNITKCDFEFNV
jgi:hypothetical protein